MKPSQINDILAQAGLASLTREQMLQLAGTPEGKQFQHALQAFSGGDAGQRTHLRAIIDRVLAGGREAAPAPIVQGQRPASDTAPPYYSFTVYGRAAALCVSEAKTRGSGVNTMQIEGALALDAGGQRRGFDWASKIIIQLTQQETYLLLALLEGHLPQLTFQGHGDRRDKRILFEAQEANLYVKITQTGKPAVNVQVSPGDSIRFMSLAYRQIRANEPHLDVPAIQILVRRLAQLESKSPA